MKIALFAYSRRGCRTAQKFMPLFKDDELKAYAPARLKEPGFGAAPQAPEPSAGILFSWADAMIFVGACGIAVRKIAPHVKDKCSDPAVICIDELGRHVIPLLSGHIGGANALALRLAEALDADAVISTATDINGLFAADEWAARRGFAIDGMAEARMVSAAILEGEIPVCSDLALPNELPAGLRHGSSGELGIFIGWEKLRPFARTLRLVTPLIRLGIGCRRGTSEETIAEAVENILKEYGADELAVKSVASIDLKADEAGLLAFCKARNWPLEFYTAEELESAEGSVSSSEFVKSVTGVDNVCERAALMEGGKLIIKKTALGGVSVAAALISAEVDFE